MCTIVLMSSDNMTFTIDEKVAALSPKIQDLRNNSPKGTPIVIDGIRGEILRTIIALAKDITVDPELLDCGIQVRTSHGTSKDRCPIEVIEVDNHVAFELFEASLVLGIDRLIKWVYYPLFQTVRTLCRNKKQLHKFLDCNESDSAHFRRVSEFLQYMYTCPM